ncbi:Uncharacterised protein g11005 [Pycnogonum litorale]
MNILALIVIVGSIVQIRSFQEKKICQKNSDCKKNECCRVHVNISRHSGYEPPTCTPLIKLRDWCMIRPAKVEGTLTVLHAVGVWYEVTDGYISMCPCQIGYRCHAETNRVFGRCIEKNSRRRRRVGYSSVKWQFQDILRRPMTLSA